MRLYFLVLKLVWNKEARLLEKIIAVVLLYFKKLILTISELMCQLVNVIEIVLNEWL